MAATFQMETSPMACKSWQPSHEPPHRKGKQAPVTLNKQCKEGGNEGGGENCLGMLQVYAQNTCKKASNKEQMDAYSADAKKLLTN